MIPFPHPLSRNHSYSIQSAVNPPEPGNISPHFSCSGQKFIRTPFFEVRQQHNLKGRLLSVMYNPDSIPQNWAPLASNQLILLSPQLFGGECYTLSFPTCTEIVIAIILSRSDWTPLSQLLICPQLLLLCFLRSFSEWSFSLSSQ